MSTTNPPLHVAVQNGNMDIVKMLLEAGHNPNEVNAEGLTPLHIAVQMGHTEIATLLIERSQKNCGITVAGAGTANSSRNKWRNIGIYVGIPVLIFTFVCLIGFIFMHQSQYISKDAYTKQIIKTYLTSERERLYNDAVKKAHVTVTARSYEVINCDVVTKDQSTTIRRDGTNVDYIAVQVAVRWDGFVFKNQQTIFEHRIYPQNTQASSLQIVSSDASIYLTDEIVEYLIDIANELALMAMYL
jgi:hypothetical protein